MVIRMALKSIGFLGLSNNVVRLSNALPPFLPAKGSGLSQAGRIRVGSVSSIYTGRAVCRSPLVIFWLFHEVYVEREALELLYKDAEGLRQCRLEGVVPGHYRLVHLGPARDIVALDREELLKGMGSAVRLHRPDLHLSEPLAAELRLAS